MVERRSIVRQWRAGAGRVLVTLVRAEGSSYRRPGAQMLIGSAAAYAGTISGGCLEAEVVRKAEWIVRAGAVVQRYSTLFDDTAEMPFGLGCGGVVDLLLEPVATPEGAAMLAALEASLAGVEATVVTWLPGPGRGLRRAVIAGDGGVRFASAGVGAAEIAQARAGSEGEVEGVYSQRLAAPQRLFVLGAGDDAQPVVTFAASLGWTVVVADGRAQMAKAERFVEADRVVICGAAEELGVRAGDAVVVMTHSYEQDRHFLCDFLRADDGAGYIGLLGARHRSSLLVSEVAVMLGRSVAECCGRVWAPVGLDLGGDGPEAIALAIVAEVQAWVQGRLGNSRRLSAEDVAAQVERGGASRYLQAQCALAAD